MRTDMMNYLIGRAPDIWSLRQLAGCRNHPAEHAPILKSDGNEQYTVNGVSASVLDGHLWALRSLNLIGQATEVFNNVPGMHGSPTKWQGLNQSSSFRSCSTTSPPSPWPPPVNARSRTRCTSRHWLGGSVNVEPSAAANPAPKASEYRPSDRARVAALSIIVGGLLSV